MTVRNRIKELRYVRAGDLIPNPKNWRRHPKAQRDALRAMWDRVGNADVLITRETPDGLRIVDGHLRADEIGQDAEISVIVTDLDDTEADMLLATLDPLAAMAEPDDAALDTLLADIAEDQDALLDGLLQDLHDLPEPYEGADYEPMAFDRDEVIDGGDDFVMIQFSVLRQHRRDIVRRIEPILAEYANG